MFADILFSDSRHYFKPAASLMVWLLYKDAYDGKVYLLYYFSICTIP